MYPSVQETQFCGTACALYQPERYAEALPPVVPDVGATARSQQPLAEAGR
jgi:hypothetical protein